MKKSTLSLAIGLLLACSTGMAKTQHLTLEQRMALLEERLEAAEMRAAKAEGQVKQLQTQQAAEIREIKTAQGNTPVNGQSTTESEKKNATSPNLLLSGYGDLKIYGDVEFNMDAESNHGLLAMTNADVNSDPTNEQWNLNGRILLGFDGMRKLDNGYFAGFSAQPLGDMHGSVNIDDAVFFFGKENDWKVKVGRFEAYDMFPLNQDTFVEYSGNTADDLYSDGYGYIYMLKEGRGRTDSGGNFLMSKTLDNWYFELNTLFKDGSDLYVDQRYHGAELENDKNVAYVRPVISWQDGPFSTAVAMETNLVNNAYGYRDDAGRWVDQSDRTGYGFTMTWDGLKADPEDGIVVNLNTAYLDAADETDFTSGVNALWRNAELGYIYAHNEIDEFNTSTFDAECENDCWITDPGEYDIHTVHASYLIPNVMKMKNFNIYLGAYASWVNASPKKGSDKNDDRYGGRVRFKYYF